MRFLLTAAALTAPLAAASAQTAGDVIGIQTAVPIAGAWTYAAQPGGSDAVFVDSTGSARVTLRCTRATRGLALSVASAAPAAAIFVTTTSLSRSVPSRFEQAAQRVTADIAVSDTLLDAVAFSRGRFALTLPGSAPLVLPTTPEPARVVEDCRN